MKRFGIRTLLIDNYEDITSILCEVKKRLKEQVVFISGSAKEYSEFSDDQNSAKDFIYKLSEQLVKNDYQVVSGYGLGVGDYVINGAMTSAKNNLKSEKQRMNSLKMYPFPQNISNKAERARCWNEYRREILSEVGYSIVVFGNKDEQGDIINASGVYDEYKIAKELDVFVIPIGLTGYMAKVIFEEEIERLEEVCENAAEIKTLFDKLKHIENGDGTTKSHDDIINTVLEIITKMKVRI